MRRSVVLAAACALMPATATAATRYVAPDGAGSGRCTRSAPCSIDFAVNGNGSRAGDTVVVLGGTYADQTLVIDKPLTLTGPEAAAHPVLRSALPGGAAVTITDDGAGAVVAHLAITAAGDGTTAVAVDGTAALEDLAVSSASGQCLRSSAVGVRIDDSTFSTRAVSDLPCVATTGDDTELNGVAVSALNAGTAATVIGNGKVIDSTFTGQVTGLELGDKPDAHRVTAIGGQRGIALSGATTVTDSVAIARDGGSAVYSASGSHQLLNITAWGEGEGAIGIRAVNGAQLVVKNSIARGDTIDLQADAASPTITGDCDVFTGCPAGQMGVDHSNFGKASGITDNGMNISRDPRFADASFEDFHLRRGSPSIDAASFEFNAGSADRDGRFRWLGKAPDMGAFEYAPKRHARPKADRVAPRLAAVSLAPARFHVTRSGTAFAARGGTARGTTLSFVLNESSDLVLTVTRRGSAAVVGTIVRPFVRGPHHMTISGELNNGFLRPGRNVLHVVARDTAQNLSRERRAPFTVVSG
jgi:hypothetical protein